ncbi:hypothetical protein GGF31_004518 [Allomyces arbusculus]|nr:hypothetical protein GGF31_004518 [Allomyces arbusculus]
MTHNDSDDVESEVRIADGAKAMPKAWMEVLGESYYRPDVSSVAGIKHKVDAIDYDSVMSVLGHDQGHGQCRSDSKDTVAFCHGHVHAAT